MKDAKSKALHGKYDIEAGRKISLASIKKVVKREYRGPRYRQVNEAYDKQK